MSMSACGGGNGRRSIAVFVFLPIVMLAVLAGGAAFGVDVSYTIKDEDNAVFKEWDDAGGATALNTVVGNSTGDASPGTGINENMTSYPDPQYTATVDITINSGQNYGGGLPSSVAGWNIHGASTTVTNSSAVDPSATIYGFKSISIAGSGADRVVLNVAGATANPLMRIQNVRDEVEVKNLTYQKGDLTAADGGIHRGGGLQLNGFSTTANDPTKITVSDVGFDQNKITLSNKGGATGGGLAVAGKGTEYYDIDLSDVDFSQNAVRVETTSGVGSHSAQGGGAYIIGVGNLTYEKGKVTDNTAYTETGSHAHGAGMYVGTNKTGTIDLKNVEFSGNIATVAGEGSGQTFARGGGFMAYGYANDALTKVTMSNDVSFTSNIANATGTGNVVATGGAVHLRHNVDATFTGTEFDQNKATSASGYAWGGAIGTDYDSSDPLNEKYTNTKVSLDGAKLTANTAQGAIEALGGAVYMQQGELSTSGDAVFTGNAATSDATAKGGAIYYRGDKTVTIADTTFGGDGANEGNTATGADAAGGAIYLADGSSTISGATFIANQADGEDTGRGGAVYYEDGIHTIDGDTKLEGNIASTDTTGATAQGGAVYYGGTNLTDDQLKIDDVTFGNSTEATAGNLAKGDNAQGGAVYIEGGTNTIGNSKFYNSGVEAAAAGGQAQGGAVYLAGGSNAITNTEFHSSTATAAGTGGTSQGGAIYVEADATSTITGSTFAGNKAEGAAAAQGGAVYYEGGVQKIDTGAKFEDSQATAGAGYDAQGGAVYFAGTDPGDDKLTINGAVFGKAAGALDDGGNLAKGDNAQGGAVYVAGGTATISGSNFYHNSAQATVAITGNALGGALYVEADAASTITGGAFIGNQASGDNAGHGGAVYYEGGKQTIDGAKFESNIASTPTHYTTNGLQTNEGGGAVYFAGGDLTDDVLTIKNATFGGAEAGKGNIATGDIVYGGALSIAGGSVNISGTDFSNNEAKGLMVKDMSQAKGGAISIKDGNLTIASSSTFVGNKAIGDNQAWGGAIYSGAATDKTLAITATAFEQNAAEDTGMARGGAIYNTNSMLSLSGGTADSLFKGNMALANSADAHPAAVAQGGAIYTTAASDTTITSYVFDANVAKAKDTAQGGAIYNNASKLVINDTDFTGNEVEAENTAQGGAIYTAEGLLELSGLSGNSAAVVSSNKATATAANMTAQGGAIYTGVTTGNALTIENMIFGSDADTGNIATGASAEGGAIYVGDSGSTTNIAITTAGFTGNKAVANGATVTSDAKGGAYYAGTGVDTAISAGSGFVNSFSNNTAAATTGSAQGGAIYNTSGDLDIERSVFDGNQAIATAGAAYGGAIYSGGDLTINGIGTNSIKNNLAQGSSEAQGGAIYQDAGMVTIDDEHFTNNKAEATDATGVAYGGGLTITGAATTNAPMKNNDYSGNQALGGSNGYAMGGALFNNSADNPLSLSNNTFDDNTVQAGLEALGGGIANAGIATGGAALTIISDGSGRSSITNNTARATAAINGQAYGGGVYNEEGTVSLTNTDVTGNKVVGTTAEGGGVFMNTDENTGTAYSAILNLTATTGSMYVNDNKAYSSDSDTVGRDSDIFFGRVDGGDSQADAFLIVTANNANMYRGNVGVDMNNGKNYTENNATFGTGVNTLSGANTYQTVGGTSTLNFAGNTVYANDYTSNFTGGTDATVYWGNNSTHTFILGEKQRTSPLFDFSNNDSYSTDSFTSGTGITIDVAFRDQAGNRAVYSLEQEVVIAEGLNLNDGQVAALQSNITFNQNSAYSRFTEGISYDSVTNTLYTAVEFISPFENAYNSNTRNGIGAIYQLANYGFPPENAVSDADWDAMLANPNALYPEIFVDQGLVMLDGSILAADTANEIGLRNLHHAYLRDNCAPRQTQYYGRGGRLNDRYRAAPAAYNSGPAVPRGVRIWATYLGDFGRTSSHGGHNGYEYDRNGFLLGINYDFSELLSVGFFGGYSHANTEARRTSADVDQDAGHFGLQARYSPIAQTPAFSLYGDLGYHFSSNKASRKYSANGNTFTADGSFDQGVFTMGVGAEYMFAMGNFNLTPFAKMRFSHLNQDGLREHGSSGSITNTRGFNRSDFRTRLGVEASYNFCLASGVVTPRLSADWQHNFSGRDCSTTASYAIVVDEPAQRFSLKSSQKSRDYLNLGAGVNGTFAVGRNQNPLGFGVGVNVRLGSNVVDTSVFANVSFGF